MPERKLVDLDQAQTYTAPNGAKYRLRPNSIGALLDGGTVDNPSTDPAPATEAVAMWKAGNYDGGSQFLKDLSGNGHHLRLGSQFPAYITKGALHLPGIATNNVSTPHSAAVNISGDFDIRMKVALPDWTPSANVCLANKWSGGNFGWTFGVNGANVGFLKLVYSATGATFVQVASTAAVPATDGAAIWVRATLDVDNGAGSSIVTFYTSQDGVAWSQLGATVSDATNVGALRSNNGLPITLGGDDGGVLQTGPCSIFYAEVRNGIDGNIVAKFDPSAAGDFTTSFTSATGETWTVNQPGAQIQTLGSGLTLDGVANSYAYVQDSQALRVQGDVEVIWKGTLTDWTPAAQQYLVASGDATDPTRGFLFLVDTSGSLQLAWYPTGNAASGVFKSSSVPTGFADGTEQWVRFTLDVDNGSGNNEVKFYSSSDGTNWIQLGTTQTTAGITSLPNVVRSFGIGAAANGGGSGSGRLIGKVSKVIMKNGINGTSVLDIDFAAQPAYTRSFSATTGQTVVLNGQTGSDTNDPKYLPYSNEKYLYMPAVDGNSVAVLDRPAFYSTDLDVRAEIHPDSWRQTLGTIIGRYDVAYTSSWGLFQQASGALELSWWETGGTSRGVVSDAVIPDDGARRWVRVTLDVDNGSGGHDAKFWTSNNGLSWTQLGSTRSAGAFTTSLRAGTCPLIIGSQRLGSVNTWAGKLFKAKMLDGINGTTIYDADFTKATPESTTIDNGIYSLPANRTTFIRSSDAYISGTQAASGTPRYWYGRNILTADANINVNLWGFELTGTATGTFNGLSSDYLWNGNPTMKFTVTNQGTNSGYPRLVGPYPADDIRNSGKAGETFVSSFWVYSPTTTTVDCSFYLGNGTHATRTNTVPANTWTRVYSDSHTLNAANVSAGNGTVSHLRPRLTWHNVGTIYVTAPQMEKSSAVTDWRQGGATAMQIEESTTNLLTANESDGSETGTVTGWLVASDSLQTIASSTTQKWQGTRSVLVTVADVTTPSNRHNYAGWLYKTSTNNSAMTASAWVYGTTGRTLFIRCIREVNGATQWSTTQDVVTSSTSSGVWQRIQVTLPSWTGAGTTSAISIRVGLETSGIQVGDTILFDGIQLEAKDFATSWHIGGGTRQADHTTIPASPGLVPFDEGSMEAIFTPGPGWVSGVNGSGDGYFNVIGHRTSVNNNEIQIHRLTSSGSVACSMSNAAGTNNGGWTIGATAVTPGTAVYVCMTWDAANIKFYVDGVLKITQPITNRPTVHGTLGIGTHPNADRRLNGELDMVRVSRTARTQAEVTAAAAAMSFSADSKTTLFQDYRSTLEGQYSALTTINRSSTGRKSTVVDRNMFLFGGDDYILAPSSLDGALDIGPNDSFTAVVAARIWGAAAAGKYPGLLAKPSGSPAYGWLMYVNQGSRAPQLYVRDGASLAQGAGAPAYTDGASSVIVGRRDATTDKFRSFVNAIGGTEMSDATTGTIATPKPLYIGQGDAGNHADMEFIGAAIWKRALTDEEIGYLAGEFGV